MIEEGEITAEVDWLCASAMMCNDHIQRLLKHEESCENLWDNFTLVFLILVILFVPVAKIHFLGQVLAWQVYVVLHGCLEAVPEPSNYDELWRTMIIESYWIILNPLCRLCAATAQIHLLRIGSRASGKWQSRVFFKIEEFSVKNAEICSIRVFCLKLL